MQAEIKPKFKKGDIAFDILSECATEFICFRNKVGKVIINSQTCQISYECYLDDKYQESEVLTKEEILIKFKEWLDAK